MIKINNVCVSKCLLHCLKQTKSKYGEALIHSDRLSKYSILLKWKKFRNEENLKEHTGDLWVI